MRPIRIATVCLLAIGLLAGCSGGVGLGEVSGTVTYDGKPVELGSISFIPIDGNGPSGGGAITDGKYMAQKVPVGAAKVRISGAKVTGKMKMSYDSNSPLVTTSTEMLPSKYSDAKETELRYDVQPGSQIKNFELAK